MVLTAEDQFPDNTSSRTYGEMVDDCALFIGKSNSNAIRPRIKGAVLNALRKMNRRRWNFTRAFTTLTIKKDTPNYELNSETRRTYGVTMMREDNANEIEWRLGYIDYRSYLSQYGKTVRLPGRPLIYTHRSLFRNGQIILYPTPKDEMVGRQFRVHYYESIKLPAEESDYLTIPSWLEGYIYWEAISELQLSVNQNVELHREALRKSRFEFLEARAADYEESDDSQYIGVR
jgi:hypothetical protein